MSMVLWKKGSLCCMSDTFFLLANERNSFKRASFIHIVLVNIICIVLFKPSASIISCVHRFQWFLFRFVSDVKEVQHYSRCLMETSSCESWIRSLSSELGHSFDPSHQCSISCVLDRQTIWKLRGVKPAVDVWSFRSCACCDTSACS